MTCLTGFMLFVLRRWGRSADPSGRKKAGLHDCVWGAGRRYDGEGHRCAERLSIYFGALISGGSCGSHGQTPAHSSDGCWFEPLIPRLHIDLPIKLSAQLHFQMNLVKIKTLCFSVMKLCFGFRHKTHLVRVKHHVQAENTCFDHHKHSWKRSP